MEDFIKLTSRPVGKRYVISDIHGCYNTFKRLVEEVIGLTKSDWLFLLGDYIDRGPSSKDVLDYILDLKESGYSLFPLRGNHEDDLLDYAKGELRFLLWLETPDALSTPYRGRMSISFRKGVNTSFRSININT